ncbi:flagellar basal body L-ring protein FlgH [Roseateles microcysteis]|uniref:flagellar basal body L-ring protein FlgH n=1 Tax=Roseateles microcysteis TaxID=3119057 RepID=UPI002FE56F93
MKYAILILLGLTASVHAQSSDEFGLGRPAPVTSMASVAAAASAADGSPVAPAVVQARPRARGSLYSDAGFQALTADRRKFQVGEVLTVMVYEDSSATSSADTDTSRDSNASVGLTLPRWSKSAGIVSNNDFNGTGRTHRAGRVLAQITVLVREVLPNGDLRVDGEQLLEINGEKQTIRAAGRVRPRDVNEQNVVLSSRMAETKLSFVGDGVLGEQQRPAWWQRLLHLLGF